MLPDVRQICPGHHRLFPKVQLLQEFPHHASHLRAQKIEKLPKKLTSILVTLLLYLTGLNFKLDIKMQEQQQFWISIFCAHMRSRQARWGRGWGVTLLFHFPTPKHL